MIGGFFLDEFVTFFILKVHLNYFQSDISFMSIPGPFLGYWVSSFPAKTWKSLITIDSHLIHQWERMFKKDDFHWIHQYQYERLINLQLEKEKKFLFCPIKGIIIAFNNFRNQFWFCLCFRYREKFHTRVLWSVQLYSLHSPGIPP